MAYTPHTWSDDETITASKLNNMEQGIAGGGGVLVCTSSYDDGDYVLNKTAGEIYDALVAGTPVYVKFNYGDLTTYTGDLTFGNVVRASNYNYTQQLVFYVVKANKMTVSGNNDSGVPSVYRYVADGLESYPVLNSKSYVNSANMAISGNTSEE